LIKLSKLIELIELIELIGFTEFALAYSEMEIKYKAVQPVKILTGEGINGQLGEHKKFTQLLNYFGYLILA
jgi:hypothetical protein